MNKRRTLNYFLSFFDYCIKHAFIKACDSLIRENKISLNRQVTFEFVLKCNFHVLMQKENASGYTSPLKFSVILRGDLCRIFNRPNILTSTRIVLER